jgi:hypothetical protein
MMNRREFIKGIFGVGAFAIMPKIFIFDDVKLGRFITSGVITSCSNFKEKFTIVNGITTHTYYTTFEYHLPIQSKIEKIWLDENLAYDSEKQLSSIEDFGFDISHQTIKFEDFDLTLYGNRVPSAKFLLLGQI